MKKILQIILLVLIILPLTSKAEENNQYKPEDFEGIWINTGIVQYGNNKPSINLDYLDYTKNDRSEGSSYGETRSNLILSYKVDEPEITTEEEEKQYNPFNLEENISGYHFGMRTQDNIRGLYYINAWYDDERSYWHDPLPLIKLIKKDNKMYLKYDLCYDPKCEHNRGGY